MASGDSFLNTLTIEGECDRSCKLRKFKDPLIFVRLPTNASNRASGKGKEQPNRRRGQSLPPVTGRQDLGQVPVSTDDSGKSTESNHINCAVGAISRLWLPVCFSVINAVCYAIEPGTGALMMTYSMLLLHHMGAVGRGLTMAIFLLALTSLLFNGSDMIYIMVVHALYYVAVSMGKISTDEYSRTKRPYGKKTVQKILTWK